MFQDMRRLAEKNLESWYQDQHRKPLIIRGARQVGKSTLVRQFAQLQSLDLIEVNLEEYPELIEVFSTHKIDQILAEIEIIHGKKITGNGQLLFLDEIQSCPQALASLRYFYEKKPELAVVSAGSLLEFVLNDHQFSMPVGRIEYLHLGPMSFSEYLLALGEEQLLALIEQFSLGDIIPQIAHQKLLNRQREYLFVGGMPEAVLRFVEEQDCDKVRQVHRSIVQTYQDDFSKYTNKTQLRRVQKIFRSIPNLLGRKVIYSKITQDEQARDLRAAIELLVQARLLIPAYHSHCSGVPVQAEQQENIYKLYFLDIGLFNFMCALTYPQVKNLEERALVNEGVIAEQFIAQHLAYRSQGELAPHLNYWLREAKSQNSEVDFVLDQKATVLAVEVKSGKSGSLKSLLFFVAEKKVERALRFDLNLPSLQRVQHQVVGKAQQAIEIDFELISLPLYLVEQINTRSADPVGS